ncbi:hypothetical protein BKA69DRAFT_1082783 [Paraphysoderma sedebokerense]|nr:hypothetical protein BKA69DRAFT_1082783 [Paraphysoderma sedebokerense]
MSVSKSTFAEIDNLIDSLTSSTLASPPSSPSANAISAMYSNQRSISVFPAEILLHIGSFLIPPVTSIQSRQPQNELYNLALVSKQFNVLFTPCLYKYPIISTLNDLKKLRTLIEDSSKYYLSHASAESPALTRPAPPLHPYFTFLQGINLATLEDHYRANSTVSAQIRDIMSSVVKRTPEVTEKQQYQAVLDDLRNTPSLLLTSGNCSTSNSNGAVERSAASTERQRAESTDDLPSAKRRKRHPLLLLDNHSEHIASSSSHVSSSSSGSAPSSLGSGMKRTQSMFDTTQSAAAAVPTSADYLDLSNSNSSSPRLYNSSSRSCSSTSSSPLSSPIGSSFNSTLSLSPLLNSSQFNSYPPPQITYLNLSFIKSLRHPHFQSLTPHLSNLTALNLSGISRSDTFFSKLLPSCPNLLRLSLSWNSNITDLTLLHVSLSNKNLTHLDITHCTELSSTGLSLVIRECSKLQYFSMNFCLRISKDIIKLALTGWTQLKWINAVGCRASKSEIEEWWGLLVDGKKLLDMENLPVELLKSESESDEEDEDELEDDESRKEEILRAEKLMVNQDDGIPFYLDL